MRYSLLILVMTLPLFALQTSEKLFECTKIFEERKGELLIELRRIDEQKQSLEALRSATDELLKKKADRLSQRESELDAKETKVTEQEKHIQEMLEEQKKVLEEIRSVKMDKIAQTYAKMKPGASSKILEGMETAEAAKILSALKPAVTGKILAKMNTDKAAKITRYLTEEKE